MMIAITLNNDSSNIIGYCSISDTGMRVKFNKEANVKRDDFFNIFNCGAMIISSEALTDEDIDFDKFIITEAEIMNFNLNRPALLSSEEHF